MTVLYQGILPQKYDFKVSAQILCGVISVALLVLSSKIQVPMFPVPMTFQTVVVLLLPVLLGSRAALSAIGVWFAMGIAGLPVFSMAAGSVVGPAYFLGATGGYLIGFAVAAFTIGWLYQHFKTTNIFMLFAMMLGGHAIIFVFGILWMAYGVPSLGFETAITAGFLPFTAGLILKSILAACLIKSFERAPSST